MTNFKYLYLYIIYFSGFCCCLFLHCLYQCRVNYSWHKINRWTSCKNTYPGPSPSGPPRNKSYNGRTCTTGNFNSTCLWNTIGHQNSYYCPHCTNLFRSIRSTPSCFHLQRPNCTWKCCRYENFCNSISSISLSITD